MKKLLSLFLVLIFVLCSCSTDNTETPVDEDFHVPARAVCRLESYEDFMQFTDFIDNGAQGNGTFKKAEDGTILYNGKEVFTFFSIDAIIEGFKSKCYPIFDSNIILKEFVADIYETKPIYDENNKLTGFFLDYYTFYFKTDNLSYRVEYYHKDRLGENIETFIPNWEIDGVKTHLYVSNDSKRVYSKLTQINDYYMEITIYANDRDVLLSDLNFDGIHFFQNLINLSKNEYQMLKYEENPTSRPIHDDIEKIKIYMPIKEVIDILGYPQYSKNFRKEPSVRYSLNDECSVYIVYGKDSKGNIRVKEIINRNQYVYNDADETLPPVSCKLVNEITSNMAYSEITKKIGYPHKIHDNFYIVDYFIDDGRTLTISYILKDDEHLYAEFVSIT